MKATLALPHREAGWSADALFVLSWALVGAGCGALAGGLIGGIGGRLAMFVLRHTSSDLLDGALTDDGFEIGVVTTDTLGLVAVATVLGAAGGVAYVMFRTFASSRWRVSAWGLACGTVGGSTIIRTEGIDFVLLDPLWLAVTMFVAIPVAGGAWTAHLVESVARSPRRWNRVAALGVLPLLPLLVFSFAFAVPLLVVVLLAARRAPLRAGASRWWGRAAALSVYAVVVLVTGLQLWDDVTTVL